jgi:hypothetical protein
MNRLIIFFCFFVIPKIAAQNWYPTGAEWYYNWQVLLDYPAHGYTQYTVDKDTIIASKSAKKIISRSYNFNNGNISSSSVYYLREDNSVVYRWTGSEYSLMYDLTLEKGDTFDIKVSLQEGCDSISAIIIDSVGHKPIDGMNLKVQYFSYTAYF